MYTDISLKRTAGGTQSYTTKTNKIIKSKIAYITSDCGFITIPACICIRCHEIASATNKIA